jgi:DNA phosphorothioation-dependent restriction protein DptG
MRDDHPTLLIESLVVALQWSDMDAVLSALRLLNAIIRTNDDSRIIFMNTNGIDVLNDICSSTEHQHDENIQDLAVQLLEDYFETENDDQDIYNDKDDNQVLPLSNHNTFTFGISSTTSESSTIAFPQQQPTPRSTGRGRGCVLPAWMTQQ